jgi:ATP-dependent DNA helicase RecQ
MSMLEERLVRLLREGPLTVAELRRRLKDRWGSAVPPEALSRNLDSPRFRRLPGDRFILAEHAEEAPSRQPAEALSIWRLAELSDVFAIVDVETTGIDPDQDRVFQVAAVIFKDGKPSQVLNRYLSPAPRELPNRLARKLGVASNPELQRLISEAPSTDSVLPDLRAALDGIPWVAHNARFDRGFLERLGLRPTFHLDTVELAGLVLPTNTSLAQEELAAEFGIAPASVLNDPELRDAFEALDGPDVYGTFHNALTDVLVLTHIYQELRRRMPPQIMASIERRCRGESPFAHSQIDELLSPIGLSQAFASQVSSTLNPFDPTDALQCYLNHQGRRQRAEQDLMLSMVHDALRSGESCACEAPTGTGKTLAYMFPALAAIAGTGQKASISTATKNLQDQLADELQQLEDWGGLSFRWALLKGSGNYLCLSHLRRRLTEVQHAGAAVADDELYSALYWLSFAMTTPDGDLEAFPVVLGRRFAMLDAWRSEVRATTACTHDSPSHRRCFRAHAMYRAEHADLLVMNHALWLAGGAGIQGVSVVVADEAHELESVATSFLETEVTAGTLQSSLRRLIDARLGTGLLRVAATALPQELVRGAIASAQRAQAVELPALGKAFREFLKRLRISEDARYGARIEIPPFPLRTLSPRWRDVQRAWRDLSELQLVPLLAAVEAILANAAIDGALARAIAGVAERLREQIADIESILEPANRNFVHVMEVSPSSEDEAEDLVKWTLKKVPIDVSQTLRAAFADFACAFVSATMETGGDSMGYSLDRVGLGYVPGERRHVLPASLPYAENAVFAIARAMVHAPLNHTTSSFVSELASAYAGLLALSQGKALLLFTARSRMEAVCEQLDEQLEGIPLLIQGDDVPHRLLQRFREEPNTVLAGLRRFWQGVDVVGESLSLVFMEKLPFPGLHDPLVRARTQRVELNGGDAFRDYLLPGMLIAFKQGFGRLVRSQRDHGAVVVFDRRVAAKSYLTRLLAALPGYVPRDPLAERTWQGLIDHIRRHVPNLLPEDATLPQGMVAAVAQRSWPELDLSKAKKEDVIEAAKAALACFGFVDFQSEAQRALTELQLEQRNVLGLMPTGSGKSLTFQIPAMIGTGLTLVVSPLVALMRDQVDQIQARGFEWAAALYGGQSADERWDTMRRASQGSLKLLYVSPERLRDPVLVETLRTTKVRALVVDEAHCVYAWGPHFRPEFLYIPQICKYIGGVPIAAVTATAPRHRRAEIIEALGLEPADTEVVSSSFARPELRYVVYGPQSRFNSIRGPQDKLRTLLKILMAAERDGDSAIVYVNTTSGADTLASQLQLAGLDARAYHGKMSTEQRHTVQDLFMDDHIRVVVCTNAFGMGVDKRGVRYVVHFDVPGDLVAYAQESGRAGRNLAPGQEAWCILLHYPRDAWIHHYFAQGRVPNMEVLEAVAQDLLTVADNGRDVLYDVESALARFDGEIDETDLRVALHRLADLGLLERTVDVILTAYVCRLPGNDPEVESDPTLGRILELLPEQEAVAELDDRTPLDLIDLAVRLGLTPAALTSALAQLAIRGEITFSPAARALALTIQAGRLAEAGEMFSAQDLAGLQAEAIAGWDHMRGWAEMSHGCRTAEILQFLGEPGVPEPCGTCDLCAPNASKPWGAIIDEDVPRPIEHVNVPGLLLEAIAWLSSSADHSNTAPPGERKFWSILVGNEYRLRDSGLRAARRNPFFGRFRTYPGREHGLQDLFNRLVELGFCSRIDVTFLGSEGPVTYQSPHLTEIGSAALDSGEYVDLTASTASK